MKAVFWILFIIVEIIIVAILGDLVDTVIGNNIFGRSIMSGIGMAALYFAFCGGNIYEICKTWYENQIRK